MRLTQAFLRAKHWQLFLVLFGIPVACQTFFMITIFQKMVHQDQPDPAMLLGYFRFFPLIMILVCGVLFGWMWSIGAGLQYKVPAGVQLKVKTFKILFFIPIVYLLLVMAGVGIMMANVMRLPEQPQPDFGLIGAAIALIIPVHLFAMFCIFYSLYFVAKTLKTVELQRAVTFSDFAGEFVLIWFHFIGVWILQPRINKLVEKDNINQTGEQLVAP